MSTPLDVGVADALAELVDQFADPLVFLRELVQNALDAGSPEVDVYTELRPSADDPTRGVMVIGVDDYGEGMDRTTIDTKLTRLFSSAKDKDLTKIGKFGIGFVSVFALRPDAVCVDTSRGGEHWRILFRADRSFVRIAREHPVDGTKIQVIKAVTVEEHGELARRAEATLRFWCKHVSGTVRWHDEEIAEPFDLPDALVTVRHEREGVRVVVGYPARGAPFHGFYNRGLTLLEGRGASFIEGVAFKVDSKYLEHTLARNDVMRDANFDKAMAVVHELVGQLPAALLERVAQRLRAGDGPAQLDATHRVLASIVRDRGVAPEAPLLRGIDGVELGAKALRKAAKAGTLWVAEERSPLVEAALADGHVVVSQPRGVRGTAVLLHALVERSVVLAGQGLLRPEPARDEAEARAWAPLLAATGALLRALELPLAALALAHFDYPDSCVAERLFVLQPSACALTPWSYAVTRPPPQWQRTDALVINADHPELASLVTLAPREPEFAAYTLVKLLHLSGGPLPVEVDAALAAASTALRAERKERVP